MPIFETQVWQFRMHTRDDWNPYAVLEPVNNMFIPGIWLPEQLTFEPLGPGLHLAYWYSNLDDAWKAFGQMEAPNHNGR